jgi:hypothetical protein
MPQKVLKLLLPANQNWHFMNVYLAKFMTYYEIHRMHREGHSINKISEYLVLNRRTDSKYLSMNEQEYEEFLSPCRITSRSIPFDKGKLLFTFICL